MNIKELDNILDDVLAWSRNKKYKGHNKHDGLNSPILNYAFGWSKWSRIIAIQTVMRAPINIRPYLLVPQTINPKGLALFCLGLMDRHCCVSDKSTEYLKEAERLLSLLVQNKSPGDWAGDCWGYHYPWQDLGFFAPANTPNAVVTCFVCEAFLEAYRLTGKMAYLDTVGSAIKFFINDLTVLQESKESLCFAYMPLPMKMRVMDVSILIGAVIAQYANLVGKHELNEIAKRLVNFVVGCQTDYHAWFYTDPPEDSPIRHDNYHTGFILDALWRYMEAIGEWKWKSNYEQGLKFYAHSLFNGDGSPRWMSDKNYPHDVHGSAQGLVSFSLAVKNGYHYEDLSHRIGQWSIDNLYGGNGRFYYQHTRYYTKRFTLLRWCNAWMFRGLSAYRKVLSANKVAKSELALEA